MRKIALIAAMVLVSASAQAGQFRNLSPADSDSRPVAAPSAPAPKIAEVPPPAPAEPVMVAPPAPSAPPAAAPETGTPPVAAPATTEAPKYVERPTVGRAAEPAKVDDTRHVRRTERRHRDGRYWTASRIIGELHRYGIYW
jgi:hypothetical protein